MSYVKTLLLYIGIIFATTLIAGTVFIKTNSNSSEQVAIEVAKNKAIQENIEIKKYEIEKVTEDEEDWGIYFSSKTELKMLGDGFVVYVNKENGSSILLRNE